MRLSEGGETFAAAANWIDAYLRAEYGATSARYRTLRQAILSRRVVLLIDGVRRVGGIPCGVRAGVAWGGEGWGRLGVKGLGSHGVGSDWA